LGYYIDCVSLTKKIKKINPKIIVVVDATQSVPHLKHNLKNTDVDFMVFSAHKMLGPTGVGVCFMNKKWIEKLEPLKLGGGMNALVLPKTNEFTFASGVDKFEGGTPNTAGIIGFGEAIKYLNKIG
jgi:cysteine desulfurase/selenocysteine lyase